MSETGDILAKAQSSANGSQKGVTGMKFKGHTRNLAEFTAKMLGDGWKTVGSTLYPPQDIVDLVGAYDVLITAEGFEFHDPNSGYVGLWNGMGFAVIKDDVQVAARNGPRDGLIYMAALATTQVVRDLADVDFDAEPNGNVEDLWGKEGE